MKREEILEAAKKCVTGDREQDYGIPENNFSVIANLWVAYLQALDVDIEYLEPIDVAAMMILVKLARVSSGHEKADNWIDIAGYAACGGEVESNEV